MGKEETIPLRISESGLDLGSNKKSSHKRYFGDNREQCGVWQSGDFLPHPKWHQLLTEYPTLESCPGFSTGAGNQIIKSSYI